MTKKHYIKIAKIINDKKRILESSSKDGCLGLVCMKDMAGELGRFFAEENPNFDYSLFLEACFK